MNIIADNSTLTVPAKDIFSSAARTLETMLPKAVLAECNRILGPEAESRDRWAFLQTTLTNLQIQGAK